MKLLDLSKPPFLGLKLHILGLGYSRFILLVRVSLTAFVALNTISTIQPNQSQFPSFYMQKQHKYIKFHFLLFLLSSFCILIDINKLAYTNYKSNGIGGSHNDIRHLNSSIQWNPILRRKRNLHIGSFRHPINMHAQVLQVAKMGCWHWRSWWCGNIEMKDGI